MIIAPTVGRVVWYYKSENQPQPHAALVAYVHSDRCINIAWFDHDGVWHNATSVTLLQDGEMSTGHHTYCRWMPYQIGQAKKAG